MNTKGLSYKSRNENLKTLGFVSYSAYLASPLWASVRDLVTEQRGTRCVKCREPMACLHHQRYSLGDLTGDDLSHIHPICNRCHKKVEFFSDGTKARFGWVRKRFIALMASRDLPEKKKRKSPVERKACRQARAAEWRRIAEENRALLLKAVPLILDNG